MKESVKKGLDSKESEILWVVILLTSCFLGVGGLGIGLIVGAIEYSFGTGVLLSFGMSILGALFGIPIGFILAISILRKKRKLKKKDKKER